MLTPLAARQAQRGAGEVLVGERAYLILAYDAVELVVEHLEHLVDRAELAGRPHRVVAQQSAHSVGQTAEVGAGVVAGALGARAHVLDRAESVEAQVELGEAIAQLMRHRALMAVARVKLVREYFGVLSLVKDDTVRSQRAYCVQLEFHRRCLQLLQI